MNFSTFVVCLSLLAMPVFCTAADVEMLPGRWIIEAKFEERVDGKKTLYSENEEACFTKDYLLSNPLLSPRPEAFVDGELIPCAHAEFQKSSGRASWRQVCIHKLDEKTHEIHEVADVSNTANTLLWIGTTKGILPGGEVFEMQHTFRGTRSGKC